MLKGTLSGQQSAPGLAGNIPGAGNPGGAPPHDIDPATPAFRDAESCLTRLINILRQFRDDVNSNQVVKLAYEIKKVQLSRRKEIAQKQADQTGNSSGIGVARGF